MRSFALSNDISGSRSEDYDDVRINHRLGRKRPTSSPPDSNNDIMTDIVHCPHQSYLDEDGCNSRRLRRLCLVCDIILWPTRNPRFCLSSLGEHCFIFHVITQTTTTTTTATTVISLVCFIIISYYVQIFLSFKFITIMTCNKTGYHTSWTVYSLGFIKFYFINNTCGTKKWHIIVTWQLMFITFFKFIYFFVVFLLYNKIHVKYYMT